MNEFDRAAQAWVERHYGVTPNLGSVRFEVDAAAYASGAWCNFEVSWETSPNSNFPSHTEATSRDIKDEAWRYDATDLMRELFEIAAELSR